MEEIIINLPKSNRKTELFRRKFPKARFYGATSLGSGRKSYKLPLNDYNENKDFLKKIGATKSRDNL